jgi:hypothetical protein
VGYIVILILIHIFFLGAHLLPLADTFFIIPLLPLADRRGKTSGLAMTGEVTPSDNHACFS